ILSYLQQVLATYLASSPEKREFQKKDGALVALGSLATILIGSKKYSGSLEGLLVTHVLPEFQSPHG
ncbi:unnamed protein product, partial [Discosporangium mesarthrocarpum]